jgi:hypothetical protein
MKDVGDKERSEVLDAYRQAASIATKERFSQPAAAECQEPSSVATSP